MSEKNGLGVIILSLILIVFAWKLVTIYWLGIIAVALGVLIWAQFGRGGAGVNVTPKLLSFCCVGLGCWLIVQRYQSMQ